MLQFGFDGFTFEELHRPAGLARLHARFLRELRLDHPALSVRYAQYCQGISAGTTRGGLSPPAESSLLIDVATQVSAFLGRLFQLEPELSALRDRLLNELKLFEFKREFVTRRVFKKGTNDRPGAEELPALDARVEVLLSVGFHTPSPSIDAESALAHATLTLLHLERTFDATQWASLRKALSAHDVLGPTLTGEPLEQIRALLTLLERWVYARATYTHTFQGWTTITQPKALRFDKLVELKVSNPSIPEAFEAPPEHLRRRDGFKLTDPRGDDRLVMGEIDYCVICHEREKDSCRHGFREKDPVATGNTFRKNALGIALTGCPLEEHISEMHLLKSRGDSLGALAMIMLDNPMCPGTGHRICNDCMKACIFQKQEPVNIPQIETSVLTDVLELPYGFELYGLLTRWNPLNAKRPFSAPANGKNVLVVGQGPAGYTLSHYLLNEGFTVVGIDGLKIEPFPDALTGANGNVLTPLRDWKELTVPLDKRVPGGFGGVSEYGITVRWDKSFLTLIHLTLARREGFRVYGGVRFGGTLTIEDAWELGFDHIALAAGAGKPTLVPMKNNMMRGIRAASDFLMALQLTGAARRDSLANLQIRLPALVIGGGLTGIDTATELSAYYPIQVEKVLSRHELLTASLGEEAVFGHMNAEELDVYREFLTHGRAVRAERERAEDAHEKPNFIDLVRSWGGVALCYRRNLNDSPAYRLNHEEVAKAMEEGIFFIERIAPTEVIADEFGAVKAVNFERMTAADGKLKNSGQQLQLPARTVCVAAGTSPNVTYEREYPGTFELDEGQSFFRGFDAASQGDEFVLVSVPSHGDIGKEAGFFTSYTHQGKFITFYGDNHPTYAGNVVKAMASARDGFPHVAKLFARQIAKLKDEELPLREAHRHTFFERLDNALLAQVVAVNRLTHTIVEIVVKAPFAAQHFEPGQFYRLQSFERNAEFIDGTRLTMEGLALTGAWVDKPHGLISTVVLEMGASSRLCARLRPNERIVLMGPTGAPTHIAHRETVLLAGGGLGNAVLFSIGQALRAAGCTVLYFAGYRTAADAYKRDDLERAADEIVWSVDKGLPLSPRRPQDRTFVGNIVGAMEAYASGALGPCAVQLKDVDRMIVIGSDQMMKAVKNVRDGALRSYFKPGHSAVGSINSPMQCMMKEICAQCLQRHVDPRTGKESFVFSCFNQDQDLDSVDFAHLDMRLKANSVLETQTDLFLSHLAEHRSSPLGS